MAFQLGPSCRRFAEVISVLRAHWRLCEPQKRSDCSIWETALLGVSDFEFGRSPLQGEDCRCIPDGFSPGLILRTGSREGQGFRACPFLICSCSLQASYSPSQLTPLFQSTNAPLGLSRQAHTWSSKKAGMPKRFGLSTNWKAWPSS